MYGFNLVPVSRPTSTITLSPPNGFVKKQEPEHILPEVWPLLTLPSSHRKHQLQTEECASQCGHLFHREGPQSPQCHLPDQLFLLLISVVHMVLLGIVPQLFPVLLLRSTEDFQENARTCTRAPCHAANGSICRARKSELLKQGNWSLADTHKTKPNQQDSVPRTPQLHKLTTDRTLIFRDAFLSVGGPSRTSGFDLLLQLLSGGGGGIVHVLLTEVMAAPSLPVHQDVSQVFFFHVRFVLLDMLHHRFVFPCFLEPSHFPSPLPCFWP